MIYRNFFESLYFKYATGVAKIKKIGGRENISVGTWNVRTFKASWETSGADSWDGQVSLEKTGEMSTDDRHKDTSEVIKLLSCSTQLSMKF